MVAFCVNSAISCSTKKQMNELVLHVHTNVVCKQLKCQFFVDLRAQTDLSKFSALTIYLTFLFLIVSN